MADGCNFEKFNRKSWMPVYLIFADTSDEHARRLVRVAAL